MSDSVSKFLIPDELIMNKIYMIRDKKVMLDEDLADLYGVTTGNLNKAVKRNFTRFPDDFMFQLTKKEFDDLIFQIGISSWGGRRKIPYVFTEQGVAMLSGVLHSERARNKYRIKITENGSVTNGRMRINYIEKGHPPSQRRCPVMSG